MENILVKDIMTEHVIRLKKNTALKDVVHLMLRDLISGVPIVDDNDELCGIVTITDLFRILDEIMHPVQTSSVKLNKLVAVSEVMTKKIIVISPNDNITDIVELSVAKNVHTFPVVDEFKQLVGILGRRDILNAGYSLID